MAIREATPDDIDAIQDVARATWEADYPTILSRDSIREGLDEWYADDQLRDAIAWARSLVLVAERDDEIVGFTHATWDVDETTGNILRVYVVPDHRNDGIGRQLFEETRSFLFDQGVDRIEAMVLEANDLGNAFYQSFGLEKASTAEITIGEDTYTERTYVLDRESAGRS